VLGPLQNFPHEGVSLPQRLLNHPAGHSLPAHSGHDVRNQAGPPRIDGLTHVALHGRAAGQSFDAARASAPAMRPVGQDLDVTHLPGSATASVVEPVIQNDAAANAGSDENRHQVSGALAGTEGVLADRARVDVVVERHRQPQDLAEHCPQGMVLPIQIWGVEYHSLLRVHGSGSSNPDPLNPFRFVPQVFPELADRCSDSPGDALGTQVGTSGPLPGGEHAAPSIQRHCRHAGSAKVNPDHEAIFLSHVSFSPGRQAAGRAGERVDLARRNRSETGSQFTRFFARKIRWMKGTYRIVQGRPASCNPWHH